MKSKFLNGSYLIYIFFLLLFFLENLFRWNFSVGQHELTLPPFEGCILSSETTQEEYIYKVVVPEGIICAVEKNAPHNIVWKHKVRIGR